MSIAPAAAKKESVFRPEIEGLRALACALVAIFHIWLGRVSGGVDVFFVVSAFLITTGLTGQIERSGTIQFTLFWGRLIKRLLPAALLVLGAVILASLLLMPKSRWKETIEEVAAAAAYMENWLLAYKSVDYLAQHEAVSPLQHFWALSAQGQIYFAWPLLFAAVAFVARRSQFAFRQAMLGTLALLFTASLAYSIVLTSDNQPFAYFNTFARIWEFCIGAVLALVLPKLRLAASIRLAAGWIGLLAILSCGLVLHVSRVFPGYAALWPTLGAALVIVAGTSGNAVGADRFLSSKPMVALGGISYGVYLWHFPILVFVRLVREPFPLTFIDGLGILAASLVLAYLTNRLIESPARHSAIGKNKPWHAFAFGAACMMPIVIGLGLWSVRYAHVKRLATTVAAVGHPNYPGALALKAEFRYQGERNVPVYPGPLVVAYDRDYTRGAGCDQPSAETMPTLCTITAPGDAKLTIAVVGGSHSAQWLPALRDIAEQERWRVISFTKSNCPFHLGEIVEDTEVDSCIGWNENVLKHLLTLKPDVIFTTSTRHSDDGELVPQGYREVWAKLAPSGIKVIAIRDNPNLGFDVSACVELHGIDAAKCSRRRAEMFAQPNPLQPLQSHLPHVRFIDLSDYFCDRNVCPPVVGNVLIYRHMNHITATYARTLAPMLRGEMLRALEAL